MKLGLERATESLLPELRDKRFGLLANSASVDRDYRYAWDALAECYPGRLAVLFSPQHGLWGEEQANMFESPHTRLPSLDLAVYSLYADKREPSPEMLADIEALVIDLQDVGTRVYTFLWTSMNCLVACAEANIPIVVLDRPNPIGGLRAEGPPLDLAYHSFVGQASIPMRHGLTLGEFLCLINAEFAIDADLTVIPMTDWRRSMYFSDCRRCWIPPSPNVPRLEGVLAYPGQVLLEGTNLSEGRGTTTPFEWLGSPFIDPDRLADEIARLNLPGLAVRPVKFIPTFDKWRGETCGGAALRITNPETFRPYETAVAALAICRKEWSNDFAWREPPYEYETEHMPIDIITGGCRLRKELDQARPDTNLAGLIEKLTEFDEAAWWNRARPYLFYR